MPTHPSFRRLAGAFSALLVLCVLAGASKEFVKPAARPARSYPAHDQHTDEGVTVAVDAYNTPEKAQIFTIHYQELDLLPLLVIITNDTDQPVTLAQMKARLVTGSRAKLDSATSDDLFRRISHPSASTNPYPLPVPLPGKKVRGTVSSKQRDEVEYAMFGAKAVEPHSTQSGFFFFDIGGISRPLAGSHFYLDGLRDSRGSQLLYFDVALDQPAAAPAPR